MAVAVAAAVPVAGTPAFAAWDATGPGTAVAYARTMPVGGSPTATAAGPEVTVTWPAAQVAPGMPAAGHEVFRYDAATGAAYPVSAGCAGRRQALRCTDTPPDGQWRYRVRPVHGLRWSGGQGAASRPVTVTVRSAASSATA
jgi:hypothetical protein